MRLVLGEKCPRVDRNRSHNRKSYDLGEPGASCRLHQNGAEICADCTMIGGCRATAPRDQLTAQAGCSARQLLPAVIDGQIDAKNGFEEVRDLLIRLDLALVSLAVDRRDQRPLGQRHPAAWSQHRHQRALAEE